MSLGLTLYTSESRVNGTAHPASDTSQHAKTAIDALRLLR
jgi:hypothetical protein